MTTKALIDDLIYEAKTLPEVLAPVISKSGVVAMVNNHPYRFKLKDSRIGWFILKPTSTSTAKIARDAYPYEIGEYLGFLPSLTCIACRRLGEMSWLVYPFNTGDAAQKLNLDFPQPSYLVTDNLEPFSLVLCRIMGNTLLYNRFSTSGIRQDELRESLGKEISDTHIKFPTPEFRAVYNILQEQLIELNKKTTEGRIEDALKYLGAELLSFTERGEGYSVRWRDGSNQHEVTVGKNLRLLSAGICLSGREHEQSLASAVAVMRRYERGYDEEDYDD